jgi:catechol-2,3-dioxygenase
MNMSVGVLDHYNVSTRKLKETVEFYEDVLGFTNGPRPPFNFPGAWLYSAGHPVLHLNDISQTDKQQRPDSGVIDHVAFNSRGFEAMKQHLTSQAVPFPCTSTLINSVIASIRQPGWMTVPSTASSPI